MNCLRVLRRSLSMKQDQMAKKLRVSYSHYVKLENGFVKPSYQLLKRIKEVFDVDMNEFF